MKFIPISTMLSTGRIVLLRGIKIALVGGTFSAAADTEITGTAAFEQRFFTQNGISEFQSNRQSSIFFETEIYSEWNDGQNNLVFKPFIRLDEHDDERSHVDIRELLWMNVGYDWELRAGIGKVFWGQTESQHLVDVINQTDSIEAVDGEDKLGQPMVNLKFIKDWGATSLFVLPYFRERTYSTLAGRLRPSVMVNADDPIYESDQERHHVDWAVRYSHTIGDWDIGASYFDGTSREPTLVPEIINGNVTLRPMYLQMQQYGIDLLAVVDSWLLKFEGISRDTSQGNFFAMTGGFEYTEIGVFDTIMDIGWLMEYQYDDRDELATGPGQNDLMVGARFAFNDVDSTELLVGYVQDLDNSGSFSGFVEASSRINDNWKWSVDAWFFDAESPQDVIYSFQKDDFVQLNLEYYF